MSWKETLATIAPTIATAVGGPMAGMAVKMATSALGIEPDEKALEKAVISGNPDVMLKLKQVEQDFQLELDKLGVERERIALSDRESARQREIQTKDNAPKVLATVIVIGFFATLSTIAFVDIPQNAVQPVSILLGALTAMLTQVGNYYFGSSAGSKQKTELLGKKL